MSDTSVHLHIYYITKNTHTHTLTLTLSKTKGGGEKEEKEETHAKRLPLRRLPCLIFILFYLFSIRFSIIFILL